MKKHRNISLSIIIFGLIFGLASISFGQSDAPQSQIPGHGGSHPMMGEKGAHHSPSYGDHANLSDEQNSKIEQERNNFSEQSRDLRAQIYQKNLELRSEIAKLQSDPRKAGELQKELSNMKAQLDQKHTEHILRIKAINPYFVGGHDMMHSGGMGQRGIGSGMGHHGSMRCGKMGGGMGGMGKHGHN